MPYPYVNPATYQPNYFLQPAPQQNNNNGLVWVQGESGAKSYLVAPGNTVLLMDSESQKFYIKSADNSGMPQPLRVFEYKEVLQGEQPTDKYVTREELDKRLSELMHKEVKANESTV